MEISFTLTGQPARGQRVHPKPSAATPVLPRIPLVSRLMALAIRFDGLIREGAMRNRADIAQTGGVSRARLSQIMHLLELAPDIQEALLFLPSDSRLVERDLRPVHRLVSWPEQRKALERLLPGLRNGGS